MLVCVALYGKYIQTFPDKLIKKDGHLKQVSGDYTRSQTSLFILAFIIIGHIFISLPISEAFNPLAKYIVFGADVLLGFYTFGIALLGQQDKAFDFHRFEKDLQPLLI